MRLKRCPVLFVLLLACSNGHRADNGHKSEKPAPDVSGDAITTPDAGKSNVTTPTDNDDQVAVSWKPFDIDAIGLSLHVFAGDGVEEPRMYEEHFVQSLLRDGEVSIYASWNSEATLAQIEPTLKEIPGTVITVQEPMNICGQNAPTRVVEHPDRGKIRRTLSNGEGGAKHMPARVIWLVEINHKGKSIIASFNAVRSLHTKYAAAREAFFGSIRCL